MHEYKHGELGRRGGRKVRNPKQAVAIALREAGASKFESPRKNKANLRKTKAKERKGETGLARAEGRRTLPERGRRTATAGRGRSKATAGHARRKSALSKKAGTKRTGASKAELYAQAKRREVPGRSKMSKAQLERAIHA